jgi:uncharacterized protein
MQTGGPAGPADGAGARLTRSVVRRRTVVGLDLAGSPRRDTGCCVLSGPRSVRASVLKDDEAIVRAVRAVRPELVIIDAPLSLPRGRRTIEDRSGPHFRECDRELRRLGVPFFPLTLGPMRMLTVRGMRLARRLSRMGFSTREGYPGGAQDLLGMPRKNAGARRLQSRLIREGLGGDLLRRPLTHDELDAVTLGWVGYLHLRGKAMAVGDDREGTIVLPVPRAAVRRRVKPT